MNDKQEQGSSLNIRGMKNTSNVVGVTPNNNRGAGGGRGVHPNGTGRKHGSSVSGGGRGGRERKVEKKGLDPSAGTVFANEATRLNSDVCKRMDPNFLKIIRVASQVGLYEYDCQAKNWASAGISGCLFFYERSQAPKHGLIILNRNSLNNFLQLLTPEIEIEVDVPHILMNNHEVIRCLWFYSKSECLDIAEDLSNRLGIALNNKKFQARSSSPGNSPGPKQAELAPSGSQILDLLFNQQQQTCMTQNPSETRSTSEGTYQMEGLNLGVELENLVCKTTAFLQLQELEDKMRNDKGASMGGGREAFSNFIESTEDCNSQSMPVNSVNERWDVTEEIVGDKISRNCSGSSNDKDNGDSEGTRVNASKLDSLGEELRATLGIKNKRDLVVNRWMADNQWENSIRDLHVQLENGLVLDELKWDGHASAVPEVPDIDSIRLDVNHCHESSYEGGDDDDDDNELAGGNRVQFEQTRVEVFERERREAAIRQTTTRETESVQRKVGPSTQNVTGEVSGDRAQSPAILLSKDQMLQALTYLLKTDADFTEKLHIAYVKSVQESRRRRNRK